MEKVPNYIQKMLDEYDAKNPPEVLNAKKILKEEIIGILSKLNEKADPVFKEFADNPLSAKPEIQLKQEINDFTNTANADEKICKPAKKMIYSFRDLFIYRTYCNIENNLRDKEVNYKEMDIYDFILEDLVDNCYDVKQNLNITTENLLCYTYELGFKNFLVTYYVPVLKKLANNKPRLHLNLSKRKKDSFYRLLQDQKGVILKDQTLSQMYRYFLAMYKECVSAKLKNFS